MPLNGVSECLSQGLSAEKTFKHIDKTDRCQESYNLTGRVHKCTLFTSFYMIRELFTIYEEQAIKP